MEQVLWCCIIANIYLPLQKPYVIMQIIYRVTNMNPLF